MKKSIITFCVSVVLLVGLCTSCCKCDLKYSGVPSQIIPVKQAIDMRNEYKNTIAPIIEDRKKDYKATEFAYVELDTLKKYIAFLEQVQKKNPKQKITGLRIYFAAYPKTITNPYYKMRELGRETVFIAPTMPFAFGNLSKFQKERKYLQNVPFSIVPQNSKDKYVGQFKIIDELLNKNDVGYKTTPIQKLISVNETSLILDDLYICPPPK